MTETAAVAAEHSKAAIRRREREQPAEAPPPAFPDVVRAHKAWHDTPADAGAASAYVAALADFERHAGRVEGAYWCTSVLSAVAVTVRRRRRHFHRATAWATQPQQQVAQLLNECDELGVRVAEVLRGTAQRIAMGLVLRTAGNLLSLVDEPSRHAATRRGRRSRRSTRTSPTRRRTTGGRRGGRRRSSTRSG